MANEAKRRKEFLERERKKEENHWRKHEIAASFLMCAEIVSFGLTPKLSYSIHSSHVLVSYQLLSQKRLYHCFKTLYLKSKHFKLDCHHFEYPSGQVVWKCIGKQVILKCTPLRRGRSSQLAAVNKLLVQAGTLWSSQDVLYSLPQKGIQQIVFFEKKKNC